MFGRSRECGGAVEVFEKRNTSGRLRWGGSERDGGNSEAEWYKLAEVGLEGKRVRRDKVGVGREWNRRVWSFKGLGRM